MEEKELWRLIQELLGYTDAEMEEDRISEGIDPDQGTLDRVRCIDVGLECGGWGEILMEVKAEKKESLDEELYGVYASAFYPCRVKAEKKES